MPKASKTPVFFVATKAKKKAMVVNFYTQKGEAVNVGAVRKVKTKEGVRFYTTTLKNK